MCLKSVHGPALDRLSVAFQERLISEISSTQHTVFLYDCVCVCVCVVVDRLRAVIMTTKDDLELNRTCFWFNHSDTTQELGLKENQEYYRIILWHSFCNGLKRCENH